MDPYLLPFVLLWVVQAVGGQTDCPQIQTAELGDTTTPSTTGLVAATIAAVSGDATTSVQIMEFNIVCLGQGTMRDLYRSVSLVVSYLDGANMMSTVQVEYQCTGGMWGFGSQESLTTAPTGTLTTALRTQCSICIAPSIATALVVSPDEHCADCNLCMGLGRCFLSQICCNYFDMSGSCVTMCPPNSSPNAIFECECNLGYRDAPGNTCVDIDDCDPNPCQNGGTCTDLVNAFSCACAPGFTGSSCMINIDECDPDPCGNGGNCTEGINEFSCDCVPGFTGETCTTNIDECDPDPCGNGGTCTDLINDYTCACVPGFTGDTCMTNIDECDPDPCGNGGTCTDLINDYTCACVPGFTGETCMINIDECDPDPCGNGGTCMDMTNNFTCVCVPGFTGETCMTDINECDPNPCENGGSCTEGINEFTCDCVPGFTGNTCMTNIDDCDPDPCQNGGTCTDGVDAFSCACAPGFTGSNCMTNIDDCDPDPCQNGGTCTDGVGVFSCDCVPGFTGETCMINVNECDPNPCRNGGNCTDMVGGFSCNCTSDYAGQTCTTRLCSGTNPCSNGGTCVSLRSVEGFTCSCMPGFTGTTCDDDLNECESNPCLNGGTCMNTAGSYMCQCSSFWVGPTCEECSRGNCLLCVGVNATCINCTTGYIPSPDGTCIEDPNFCDPECQQGMCKNRQCVCPGQFTGDDCSDLCSAILPNCFNCSSSDGGCVECLDGFMLIGGRCRVPCADVRNCAQCSDDGRTCTACQDDFILSGARNFCDPTRRNRLTDAEIIGIIVGSIVAAISIISIIACLMSWAYQLGERPRMKKRPKRGQRERENPVFEKPANEEC